LKEIEILPSDKEHVFVKNMAHHLVDMDISFFRHHLPIFLIRDPKQLIASFAQVIPDPTMEDIGLEKQFEVLEYLLAVNKDFEVIDSGDLLKDPRAYLNELCNRLAIDFREKMLAWPSGAIPADGVWAKYWYENVHKSGGFKKQSTSQRLLPENCIPLYNSAMSYYEELSKYALKI